MSFMQTYTGIPFDLTTLTSDMVHPHDIMVSLSRQVRFNGHTKKPYTIGQHSVLVADMVEENGGSPELILAALLHDGHEAYMSDIPSPIKWALKDKYAPFKELESKVDAAIAEHFGFDPILFSDPLLKHADGSALWHEKEALLEDYGLDWSWDLILHGKDPLTMPKEYLMDLSNPWNEKRVMATLIVDLDEIMMDVHQVTA